ncbi:vesicle transport protein USE1-like [Anneissia japonica]|uniref:vesicle transport protein USE1-like n=1 Tax=Anneissia japonica TaxID=1529436 RepID=UPI0014256348|nr:vesicle transport protein USE1-like [Anneissia japonica]
MGGVMSQVGVRVRAGDVPKYVSALDQRYADLKKSIHVPAKEKLIEYGQKVDFIKGLLKAYKLNGALERAECSQLLATSSVPTLPDSKTEIGKTTTKRLHLQATSHYTNEMRKELLGDNVEDGSIQESGHVKVDGSEDLDEFLQQHQNMQEKLAENMISLVRRLKNTTSAAGDIIKKDNERLESTLKQADTNTLQLKVQSARMEKHSKKSCNWWMWGMLALVFMVYLWMIMFIRMFPKK